MPVDLKEYEDLRKQSERLKSKADKAEGALQQHMERLKSEFGCVSIEQAEAVLLQLTNEQEQNGVKYERKLKTFKERWEEKLNDSL